MWTIATILKEKKWSGDLMLLVLAFIFYKYLSEKIECYVNKKRTEKKSTFKEAWVSYEKELRCYIKESCIRDLGYFIEPEYLYSSIMEMVGKNENMLPALERSLRKIEYSAIGEESENSLNGLFADINLASPKLGKTTGDKNESISNMLRIINNIDLGLREIQDPDIGGDAYEYLISQFAADTEKKDVEFYTPQEVSQVLAEIVTAGKTKIDSIYDPTCGSGSLLLRAAKAGNADKIFGQEKDPGIYNLCRMNVLFHGINYKKFDIRNTDTLETNSFGDRQFDAIVAHPPFSVNWDTYGKWNDERFSNPGILAPKSKADYAFILHMIHHLSDNGTLVCIAPHGVLFREASEGKIRRFLIEEKNCIDAVIGLPANLFYGTGIPVCILVIKKCRKDNEDVLFIDASKEFEKVKIQNKLNQKHIDKITGTYRNRTTIEKYSYCASLQEIKDNDYNLTIPRYVNTFEEEEKIDTHAVINEIRGLEAKKTELEKQIEASLKALEAISR